METLGGLLIGRMGRLPGVEEPYAFARIGHCLFARLVGLLGAAISPRMYGEAPRPPEP
ncbi:hypothetical protein [Singulisphaera sp. PoT]|uniref:hypothetical protein n=1 Tax=Singulisphaera sp. PoT TaxID=3411797 RepID=UPI003BF4B2FC